MKRLIIAILSLLSVQSYAQVPKEFDTVLAKELIQICVSYTYLEFYGDDSEIIPEGYELIYTSQPSKLDNVFQVYTKDSMVVFNFRGSTSDIYSWYENFLASMIPANDVIRINEDYFNYSLSKDSTASVHSGYVIGLAYIYEEIFGVIDSLNAIGYHDFVITGHSQGGALSNMLRALLENLPEDRFPEENTYRTYAFAAPMIGNKTFVQEYNQRYCKNGTSFNIINPEDGIPKLPSSFNDSTRLIYENLVLYFTSPRDIDVSIFVKDAVYLFVGDALTNHIYKIGQSLLYRLSKNKGQQVILPPTRKDLNYHYVTNVVYLPPIAYPEIVEDSLILKNGKYRNSYSIWDNKKYFTKKNVKGEPPGYQHKPYNYYIAYLLRFFPEQYAGLEQKFLPESL